MKKNIFEYRDYKIYLKDFISSRPRKGHGIQSQMAEQLNCHSAYITQVLKKNAHFSLEQAESLNTFLAHNSEESNFFLLLIQVGRAGTKQLKERLLDQLKNILEKRQVLKERFSGKNILEPSDQMTYYSEWYYSAIHILISIPEFRTKDSIANKLGLTLEKVSSILEFLQSIGLVVPRGNQYEFAGNDFLFLGDDSPLLPRHHSNWRIMAINALSRAENKDVHFSTVVSLSKSDIQKIKEKIISEIESSRTIIRNSAEEELYCYNLDFFKIGN